MKNSYFLLSLLLTLSLAAGMPALAATPAPVVNTTDDIRIVIDVSGSMKKNDPGNLRVPALRLLTGLLPSGTQAGVWTFGRYVNMLVPYGTVNTAWRDQAMDAAERINAAGLYTDIETALDKATWNWTAAAPGARRGIILLTDGLVDVSDDPDADRQSRARITDKLLPRLQGAGALVYTIALSDDADEALLQQMAASTGGTFERADNAAELERIFFRMFEKAASPDTLPLIDNKVLVDESIQELTLLIFRKENAPATMLVTPDGVTFDQARLPPNARWHKDARYDLVTIDKPMTGTWHVNADIDPDNRVMVVSNLRVVATQLPNQILQDDVYDLLVRFTEKNRAIMSKDFLHFLKVNVLENSDRGEPSERLLLDNGRDGDITAGDGIFSAQLDTTGKNGRRTIIIDVDGTTFKRQHRQDVEVVESPVIADIRTNEGVATLFVIPRAGIINPDTLEAYATITDAEGVSDSRRLTRTNPGEWRLGLGEYSPEASHHLTVDIEAERPNGKPISYQGKPLYFGQPPAAAPERPAETPSDESAVVEPAAPEAAAIDEAEEPEETTEQIEPAPTSWVVVISLVVLLNVILGGGMFFGYRKFFGAKATSESAAEATAETPDPIASAAPAAFDSARPSVVTQVAEAAAEAKTETDAAALPAGQDDVRAEMDAAMQDSTEPLTDEAEAVDASRRAASPPAGGTAPELVLEDDTGQDPPSDVNDHLKNLNVDEIDLGFDEKARNTG